MHRYALFAAALLLAGCPKPPTPPPPLGTVWQIHGAETTVSAASGFGAAIYSLTWNGHELVNAADLGREIQTAYQLDGKGEAENPTEAGSSTASGRVPSQVISAGAVGKVLATSVHPSYWEPYNGKAYLPDTITKRVEVDYHGIANLVRHDVTVTIADGHSTSGVEGLTGYMTSMLSLLYARHDDGALEVLPYDPTIRSTPTNFSQLPLILANQAGTVAFGIYTSKGPPYTAWMAVSQDSRKVDAHTFGNTPQPAATIKWTVYYVVGTLADVNTKLGQVIANP